MRTLTVTVCQLDNRAQHRSQALHALRRHVVARGSELLVLPELPFSDWLAADPVPDAARWQHSVEAHRAAVDQLQELGVRAVVASRPTVEVTGSRRNQARRLNPQVCFGSRTGPVGGPHALSHRKISRRAITRTLNATVPIKPVIDSEYPLERTADAIALVKDGRPAAKVVVTVAA